MTPEERKKALEHGRVMQAREDAQARRFLLAILQAAGSQGARVVLIRRLAVEAGIFWRNVERARRQMEVVSNGRRFRGSRHRNHRWWLQELAPAAVRPPAPAGQ